MRGIIFYYRKRSKIQNNIIWEIRFDNMYLICKKIVMHRSGEVLEIIQEEEKGFEFFKCYT